jgi:hypothetical protein
VRREVEKLEQVRLSSWRFNKSASSSVSANWRRRSCVQRRGSEITERHLEISLNKQLRADGASTEVSVRGLAVLISR